MAPTLNEIANAVGTTYDFINNLIRRKLLTTSLSEAGPGVARAFTRENALEIAFIAALVDIGRAPAEAVEMAERWLAKEARGKLEPWWLENRFSGEGSWLGSSVDEMTLPQISKEHLFADDIGEGAIVSGDEDISGPPVGYKPATRIAAIHVAALIERVDALFVPADRD